MGKQKNFTEPRFVKSITIENKPPKWFLLTGFKTFAEANLRGCELYKYGKDEIGTIFVANNNSFAVKISENIINKLTQDEQTRLKVMPICTEIRPYVPPLYRFLEKEYVDEFFSTGKLKLTTFDNCAKHANKYKNDTEDQRNDGYFSRGGGAFPSSGGHYA